jgi:hypothetical protein
MADGTTARADPDHSATLRTAVTLQNDLHIVVHTLGGSGRSATATVNWTGDSSLLAAHLDKQPPGAFARGADLMPLPDCNPSPTCC